MKPKFVNAYMDAAYRFSELSHARTSKNGAVVVKDDTLTYGYNGMPDGWDNNCENIVGYVNGTPVYKTKPEVLHAASNAIAKMAKSTIGSDSADLFITHTPCMECAKLIKQANIKRVYFGIRHQDDPGLRFLKDSGIETIHIERK